MYFFFIGLQKFGGGSNIKLKQGGRTGEITKTHTIIPHYYQNTSAGVRTTLSRSPGVVPWQRVQNGCELRDATPQKRVESIIKLSILDATRRVTDVNGLQNFKQERQSLERRLLHRLYNCKASFLIVLYCHYLYYLSALCSSK